MKLYDELFKAISEVISVSEESNIFKTRFPKLVENFFENSYAERDINDTIELIGLTEESTNGD